MNRTMLERKYKHVVLRELHIELSLMLLIILLYCHLINVRSLMRNEVVDFF